MIFKLNSFLISTVLASTFISLAAVSAEEDISCSSIETPGASSKCPTTTFTCEKKDSDTEVNVSSDPKLPDDTVDPCCSNFIDYALQGPPAGTLGNVQNYCAALSQYEQSIFNELWAKCIENLEKIKCESWSPSGGAANRTGQKCETGTQSKVENPPSDGTDALSCSVHPTGGEDGETGFVIHGKVSCSKQCKAPDASPSPSPSVSPIPTGKDDQNIGLYSTEKH